MAELKIKKGDEEVFHYETKKNDKKYSGKVQYRGMTRFEYQICWTLIWAVFIFGLCALFGTATPLWLLIFWMMGSKW